MPSPSTTTRPPILFLAAAVLVVEALAALGFGLVETLQLRQSQLVGGLSVAVLFWGYGVTLILIARGVARGRRWSRGPAVATQLLQGLLATSLTAAPTRWQALALGGSALLALGCLLSPRATAVFVPADPAANTDPEPER